MISFSRGVNMSFHVSFSVQTRLYIHTVFLLAIKAAARFAQDSEWLKKIAATQAQLIW